MYFGVDYHPEQWVYPYGGTRENPEAAWERDVELMQTAGINVVRMGEFSWGICEPEEGKYDFGWLKRVMNLLGKAGIKVVLATPTAAPPATTSPSRPATSNSAFCSIATAHSSCPKARTPAAELPLYCPTTYSSKKTQARTCAAT